MKFTVAGLNQCYKKLILWLEIYVFKIYLLHVTLKLNAFHSKVIRNCDMKSVLIPSILSGSYHVRNIDKTLLVAWQY